MTEDSGFIVFVETGDLTANNYAARLLEEGQWHDLGKGWRARSDKPHTTGMQPHTHVYLRGNELYIINRDGTPSHNSDLSDLPARITHALKAKSLVESILIEVASVGSILVPPMILQAGNNAWSHARLMHLAIGHLGAR